MKLFIDALKSIVPNISEDDLEKVPSIILAKNIEQLMKVREIKSLQLVVDQVQKRSGLNLSKSQLSRVKSMTSEATGSTLLKIGIGLCASPEDFHYLYDYAGFDSLGEPIGKYINVKKESLIQSINNAHMSLASISDEMDIVKMVSIALVGYRAEVTNDYQNVQKETLAIMTQ
jgi:hypothetical protein